MQSGSQEDRPPRELTRLEGAENLRALVETVNERYRFNILASLLPPFFVVLVMLNGGQAIYIGADEAHSYLECSECNHYLDYLVSHGNNQILSNARRSLITYSTSFSIFSRLATPLS